MKYFQASLFFFLIVGFSFAQSFNSPTAKWHYNQGTMISPVFYPVLIEPVASQTVLGHVCSKLQITGSSCNTFANYFVYESNDSVYYFLDSLKGFSLLYDFNATLGATYTVYGTSWLGYDSIKMHIDSIHTILINGHLKKQFYTSQLLPTSLSLWLGPSYIEDIGNITFLFPQFPSCDPITAGLRCYEDSILGLYETGIAPTCDSIYYLGISNLGSLSEINFRPNPFENKILISGENTTKCSVKILNAIGELIYFSRLEGKEIDLGYLKKGIYFITIADERNSVTKKIVKQ